jgi:hypothetical protein
MSATQGVCSHCNSRFNIELPQTDTANKTEEYAYTGGATVQQDRRTYSTVWDGVAFIRTALLSLATDKQTPKDILRCEFSQVQMLCKHFASYEVTCEVDYSYEEKVEKKIERTFRGANGLNSAVEETVIEWVPRNGQKTIHKSVEFITREDLVNVVNDTATPCPPSDQQSATVVEIAGKQAKKEFNATLARLEIRNYRGQISTRIDSITTCVKHEYVVDYNYNGKVYRLATWSHERNCRIGKPNFNNVIVKAIQNTKLGKALNVGNKSIDVKNETSAVIKPLKKWLFVAYFMLIVPILGWVLSYMIFKNFAQVRKLAQGNSMAEAQGQKLADIGVVFANKNLASITQSESQSICTEHSADKNTLDAKVKQIKTLGIVSLVILVVIIIIGASVS